MITLLRIHSLFTLMIAVLPVCFAQTDPKNVPRPPTAELKKFDPFLGKFSVSGDFANMPWTGTLELKKVIKGWYIEQIVLVRSEGMDREFWILATWDKNVGKYRSWGFQTLPIMPDNGGEISFEGDEMSTEWVSVRPDGSQAKSSNRYRFVSKDELEILSYRQVGKGPVEKIGSLRGKRMLNAEEASASTPDHPPVTGPQPAPEMQQLADVLVGRWSINEKYEPDEWTPNGGVGYGEEVWRRGPGGFTLMEELHDHTPNWESFGLALTWWDKDKGLQGMWCVNSNPKGCDAPGSAAPRWDGKQLIIENEFERDGKKFVWHELYSDITPTSFLQTADIGEKGGSLKRWVTIHGKRVANSSQTPSTNTGNTVAPSPEMQKIADILSGTWSGTLKVEPTPRLPSGGTSEMAEVWRASPGGIPLIEENHMKTTDGESYDYAAVWWNGKAQKYQGIWCADINDEGCNGFDAELLGNQVIMTGEWKQKGKRRAWKEVFAPTTSTSATQTLDIGEPGGELKRVSAIHATRAIEAPLTSLETPEAEAELHADSTELARLATEAGKAYASRDLPTLEQLTAEDYVQTDVRGAVLNRAQWVEFVKNRRSDLTVDTDDVRVSYYGTAAIVTGRWTYRLKVNEKETITYSRWTSVWTRYPDGWKRHNFQNTYVNALADRCAVESHQD